MKKLLSKLSNAAYLIFVVVLISGLGLFLVQGLPYLYEYASMYMTEARFGEILVETAAIAGALLLAYIVFA